MSDEPCICRNCEFWDNTLPALARAAKRPAGADPDVGVCQFSGPTVVGAGPFGGALSYYPETHATRTCVRWMEILRNGPEGGESAEAEVIDLAEHRNAA